MAGLRTAFLIGTAIVCGCVEQGPEALQQQRMDYAKSRASKKIIRFRVAPDPAVPVTLRPSQQAVTIEPLEPAPADLHLTNHSSTSQQILIKNESPLAFWKDCPVCDQAILLEPKESVTIAVAWDLAWDRIPSEQDYIVVALQVVGVVAKASSDEAH